MNNNICYCRRCNGVVHTIQRGDTLYRLSRTYGVAVEDILYSNPFINMYNLRVGERICIPVMRTMDDDMMDEFVDEIVDEFED